MRRVVQLLEEDDGNFFWVKFPERNDLLVGNIKRLIPKHHRNTDLGMGWQPDQNAWRFPTEYQQDLILLIERLESRWGLDFVEVMEDQ